MEVIRNGVFETNSSSTHSICISRLGSNNDHLQKFPDGFIYVFPNKFGWEERIYNDPCTKASYCLTYVMQFFDHKSMGMNSVLGKDRLEMLTKAIALHESVDEKSVVFSPMSCSYYNWGYIDHQSSGVCSDAFSSINRLKSFIFNSKSILITDNDNH